MKPKFMRIRDLATTPERQGRYPVSPATIWRWVAAGKFPRPRKLGPQTSAWLVDEIDNWDAEHDVESAA